MWSCGKGSALTGNAAQFPGEPDRKLGKKPQGKRNVSCQDRGSAPLHPSANDSNLNGKKRKERENMRCAARSQTQVYAQEGEWTKSALQAVGSTGAPALDGHSSPLRVMHGCFSRLLKCTNSSHWLLWIFYSQFQKQGSDVEKVKQRLAEIANYVDKVKYPLPIAPLSFCSHLINLRWQQRLMRWLFDILTLEFENKNAYS